MMNLLVFTKKSVFMQRIADAVRQGHHWHVSGQVTVAKADYLVEKLTGCSGSAERRCRLFAPGSKERPRHGYYFGGPRMMRKSWFGVLLKTDGKEYLPGPPPRTMASCDR